jgi:hypothetical protein
MVTLSQASKDSQAGLAYGVFRCSDQRPGPELLARFKLALENIIRASDETKIPPETVFSVFDIHEGKIQVRANGEGEALIGRIVVLENKGANYMIFSSLPNAPNEIAARDLGDTINMLYGGTELFDAENSGTPLVMDIFFKNVGGAYVSKLEMDEAAQRLIPA